MKLDTYIQKCCSDPVHFINTSKEKGLEEVFKNPYYLVNSVEIYNTQLIVPENKTDFFNQLILQRIKVEKEKRNFFRDVDEFALVEALNTLALTMQYAGKNQITNLQFCQIVRDDKTRKSIKRIFFNQDFDNWQFEHNNFQEFLAAKFLSNQEWKVISKTILLQNMKLKPKWLNAFSFLINMVVEDTEMISIFIQHDIDSLVKVEPDRIDNKIRNQIFKQIFEKHKKEATTIWRFSYSIENLFAFGKLETNFDLIRFLKDEIKLNQSNKQTIVNAVFLLAKLDSRNSFISEIHVVFLKLLQDSENIKVAIINITIIESFKKWKLFDLDKKLALIQN